MYALFYCTWLYVSACVRVCAPFLRGSQAEKCTELQRNCIRDSGKKRSKEWVYSLKLSAEGCPDKVDDNVYSLNTHCHYRLQQEIFHGLLFRGFYFRSFSWMDLIIDQADTELALLLQVLNSISPIKQLSFMFGVFPFMFVGCNFY